MTQPDANAAMLSDQNHALVERVCEGREGMFPAPNVLNRLLDAARAEGARSQPGAEIAATVLARIRAGEIDARPAADALGLGWDQDGITAILAAAADWPERQETGLSETETTYEFVVFQHDEEVACGEASDCHEAIREAAHYAAMYGQDGPVEASVYEVVRRLIWDGGAPADTTTGSRRPAPDAEGQGL